MDVSKLQHLDRYIPATQFDIIESPAGPVIIRRPDPHIPISREMAERLFPHLFGDQPR